MIIKIHIQQGKSKRKDKNTGIFIVVLVTPYFYSSDKTRE